MRIMILNPPHPSIGSRIPREHLPPLGLLALGGSLVDAGHEVKVVDGELKPMTVEELVVAVEGWGAQAVLVGHSGSTSAHPVAREIMRGVRRRLPGAWIIYGGVFPSYHWREVMEEGEGVIDVVVRGEGEKTIRAVAEALEAGSDLGEVEGIAYWEARMEEEALDRGRRVGRHAAGQRASAPAGASDIAGGTNPRPRPDGLAVGYGLGPLPGPRVVAARAVATRVVATRAAGMIEDLEAYRVGWELVDLNDYSYWGGVKAVVVQFSRGCPHMCSYCGQRGFWTKWRHRDPAAFAAEIAWLHRTHGVELFNFADENPTASKKAWQAFLEALIATGVKVKLVGSTRADDIVRDADILHLYKRAGVERWLMGMENYDEATLKKIRKGGSMLKDRKAIQLLRQHGILSMATWVVGFEEERDRDYVRGLRQLLSYDPDQIQMLYATPHRWTPLFEAEKGRRVLQMDQSKWDYKHQVLATRHVPGWRVILWVKLIEVVMQMRPRALGRVLFLRDRAIRRAQRWYYKMGRRVWFREVFHFLFLDRHARRGPSLGEFWNREVDGEESMRGGPLARRLALPVVEGGCGAGCGIEEEEVAHAAV